MPITLPFLSVSFLATLFVPAPVILHAAAALAVVGAAALVLAVLRTDHEDAEPPVIVTRGPRVVALREAA